MEGGAESVATRIMVGVNESTIKGYPHASISSKGAFEWTLKKIVRSNTSSFKLLFLHVQVHDEDGSLSLSLSSIYVYVQLFIRKSASRSLSPSTRVYGFNLLSDRRT